MDRWLVISYHYHPENTAASERVHSFVEYLTSYENKKVIVVTLCSDNSRAKFEQYNNLLAFCRVKSVYYIKENFIFRAIGEFVNSLKIIFKARKFPDEIILISIPSIFLMFLAPLFLRRKVLILDIRDLVWDYLPAKSFLMRWCKSILMELSRLILNCYDLILVTNKSQFLRLESFCRCVAKRLKIVENGLSRSRFDGLKHIREQIKDRSVKTHLPLRIISVGNVGLSLHIETLIQTAHGLPTEAFQFYIVGSGVQFKKACYLVNSKRLTNIHFLGQQEWNQLGYHYTKADFLYLQIHPDFYTSRPVRLYEYLATGLPIILADGGEASEFVNQFDNIYIIDSCCVEQLKILLLELKNKYSRKFSEDNVTKIALNYIREDKLKVQLKDAVDFLNREYFFQ